ncbi:hypothetical protein K503DRAFT_392219 [Rhizopogon vinicolor AM-OR11-026]|uniref:Uncharacterized protein n=1 Tax=Rhizopogon vinicolor AM-OR11-026 TaxID=1314800 RepID=A0A1B7MRC1_9AGAM|nr:hypothetical protein K503DRAFT_392219 [Rhizopogon vinicolor AM-OR11-026]
MVCRLGRHLNTNFEQHLHPSNIRRPRSSKCSLADTLSPSKLQASSFKLRAQARLVAIMISSLAMLMVPWPCGTASECEICSFEQLNRR